MKLVLCIFFVVILGLLGWRMNVLLNPKEKVSRAPVAVPVEKRKSEVQEWLKNRDLYEKRSQENVNALLDD